MSIRIITIISINCSFPIALLTLCWDNVIFLHHETVTVTESWRRKAPSSQEKTVGLILILLKSTYYWFQMIWCPRRPSFRSIGLSCKSTFVLQIGLHMFIIQYQAILNPFVSRHRLCKKNSQVMAFGISSLSWKTNCLIKRKSGIKMIKMKRLFSRSCRL